MRPFRRRGRVPPRQPHPDARIEAELQRVISLRRAVARKETLLDKDHRDIGVMRRKLRHDGASGSAPMWAAHAEELQSEAAGLEAEIAKLHDEIAERISRLDDSDLAWLEGSPA